MALLTRTGLRINRYCSMSDFPCLRSSWKAHYASSCQFSRRSVEPFRKYDWFSIFKMAAVRHLGFSKVGNFNFLSHLQAQFASLCQICMCRQTREKFGLSHYFGYSLLQQLVLPHKPWYHGLYGRHLDNRKLAISPERFDWSSRNLAWWRTLGFGSGPEVEISDF